MEFRFFDDDAAAKVTEWRPHPTPFLPQAAVADAVADRLARALALTPPRTRSPTYQDFVAADRKQAASSEQASALDLTLAGIATGPTNSEYNPMAFPTFMEWDKVKTAVDPSVDRPRPKAPELVPVNHLPWYPIQPICVKEWLDHWEHCDLAPLGLANQARWVINLSYNSYRLSLYYYLSIIISNNPIDCFGAILYRCAGSNLIVDFRKFWFKYIVFLDTFLSNPNPFPVETLLL